MSTSATDAEIHRLRRMETYFDRIINAVDIAANNADPTGEIIHAATTAVKEYREEGNGKWARGFAQEIDIVFDTPPSADGPRFVEVEDRAGRSLKIGDWVERHDGYWVLRLKVLRT